MRAMIQSSFVLLSVVLISGAAAGQVPARTTPARKAPIYFNTGRHNEGVGSPCQNAQTFPFPDWGTFKANLKAELALLDDRGIVSDQCFSDFIVSVALYMRDHGDPNATDIFDWFKNSKQNLGYHFHPTTWYVTIRTDKILDLEFEDAVTEYKKWEQACYDWDPCFDALYPCMNCGVLDQWRLGGVLLMEQYFGKLTTTECATMNIAAVGRVFRDNYSGTVEGRPEISCWAANPHFHYRDDDGMRFMWVNDLGLSLDPFIYTYKMMGLYFFRCTSNTLGGAPVSLLAQKLEMLPRDVPHVFSVALSDPIPTLDYLQNEFIPANPGSKFISGADIPGLVVENPRRFSMEELEEAAAYFLHNYMARPPAFIKYGDQFMSNASLFKALQFALRSYLLSLGSLWPEYVDVPDFIEPPMGRQTIAPRDYRAGDAMTMATFAAAVTGLPVDEIVPTVPYTVTITLPPSPPPLTVNPAEFLTGMCTLFIRLRDATDPLEQALQGPMHMLPGYIVPISNMTVEADRVPTDSFRTLTLLDWCSDLQLWTLEPLALNPCGAGFFMKADLSGDCCIDFTDLAVFASAWVDISCIATADIDGDCDVDFEDLRLMVLHWLEGK